MPSIKKNFLYSGFLTTANYIFPLLTYPYVSRVLGVTNIGACNFVDSIIHYFIIVSMMGVSIVGIREVAACKNDKIKLSRVFGSLFLLNTITTCIALVAFIIAVLSVEQLREHWQLMAVGAVKLVTNYMLIEWLYQGLEEFKFITIRTIVVKITYVVSVFILVREQDDYVIYYLLTVLMVTINALINILYSRKHILLCIHGLRIKQYVKPYLILGIRSLLTSMYTTLNVAYLGFVAGEVEVGYYTTASKFFHILIALFTAFTGVMLPRMSFLLSEGKTDEFKRKLSQSIEILFLFSIPAIIMAVVYAPVIIRFVAGDGYEGAVASMRIIMPLVLVIGYEQIIIIQGLMPLKQDKSILRNSIAGALVGILLNITLVSTFKSFGSSIVWLTSELVVLASAQYYIWKCIGVGFPWKRLMRWIAIYLPFALMVCGIYIYVDKQWLSATITCLAFWGYEMILQHFMPNEIVASLMKLQFLKKNHV